jgi:hypothetical protein
VIERGNDCMTGNLVCLDEKRMQIHQAFWHLNGQCGFGEAEAIAYIRLLRDLDGQLLTNSSSHI